MKRLKPFADVKPSKAEEIFRYTQNAETATLEVDVRPVTFRLTEKPQNNKADLYVTVSGRICFSEAADGRLLTVHYKTQAGYFRQHPDEASKLKHVFGVHYDFDGNIAHPIFHSQMAPMLQFKEAINRSFSKDFRDIENCIDPILANVRIPTAQMDPFAVFLQLCSDHLINEKTERSSASHYTQAIAACDFFDGACVGLAGFNRALERRHIKSQHWYER